MFSQYRSNILKTTIGRWYCRDRRSCRPYLGAMDAEHLSCFDGNNHWINEGV